MICDTVMLLHAFYSYFKILYFKMSLDVFLETFEVVGVKEKEEEKENMS